MDAPLAQKDAQASQKEALLRAGVDLFGRYGLDGVGTRALAEAAGTRMSMITYHFGGKAAFYLACAAYIADYLATRIGPTLDAADNILAKGDGVGEAREALRAMVNGLVAVMMRDEVAPVARFVVREQMAPSEAFEVLYGGVMSTVTQRIARLLRGISNDRISPEEARLRTIAIMGQAIGFRAARATLMALTGWTEIGPRETEAVRRVVLAHLDAIIADLQEACPS